LVRHCHLAAPILSWFCAGGSTGIKKASRSWEAFTGISAFLLPRLRPALASTARNAPDRERNKYEANNEGAVEHRMLPQMRIARRLTIVNL
jgi:hypothetical protein